ATYGLAQPRQDERAADWMLLAKEGYAFGDAAGGPTPITALAERRGAHGHDPQLAAMDAVFFAAGRRIKPGTSLGEIKNTAVAPTIAALLSLNGIEGQPLTAALAD